MKRFNLKAPFTPDGDQPSAIEQIVNNVEAGAQSQVLLGATGTGKSVAWDEPVTVRIDGRPYRGPIGLLIDQHLKGFRQNESAAVAPSRTWEVMSWDVKTGKTSWEQISVLSRHASPDQLFRLTTSCGRTVTVTGDHSVWVLRDGHLCLVEGSQVRETDALPVPALLPEPPRPLTALNLIDEITSENVGVQLRGAVRSQPILAHILAGHYEHPNAKAYRVVRFNEGVHLSAARQLLACNIVKPFEISLKGKIHSEPVTLPLTPAVATIFGQYIAEGHCSIGGSQITVRDPYVHAEVGRCLKELNIPFGLQETGDYRIGIRSWRDLLSSHMGTHAHNKRLPSLWPSFSNKFLAKLLSAYFEGDGGVEKGAVTAVTLSPELASDIAEALLRFGIWARFRPVSKLKPDGTRGMYHLITISGQDNLRAFAYKIGFISPRKSAALLRQIKSGNTNVDLVYGVGKRLLTLRQEAGLLQRDVALKAGCTRTMISAIEVGIRNPSRTLFERICASLDVKDEELLGLTRLHWSPIASCEPTKPLHPYVYDFSVPGLETFMTGRGGLFVHNTFIMANAIERLQRPTLVMAHNKTLAAQLFAEFREFFPDNAVQYFVSYYDYYQPEAYIPMTDTYIEKDSAINEEIEKFRHASTHSILTRRDTIIVASVSCIYGLGSPDVYRLANITVKKGEQLPQRQFTRKLADVQYERNDIDLSRGRYRVQGDTITIFPAYEDYQIRIVQFGDEVESIDLIDPITQKSLESVDEVEIFPAKHFLTEETARPEILAEIERDMRAEVADFEAHGKLLEAQRLKQRVTFDLEMIRETGSCSGIENYSRYFDRRAPGTPPSVLLDYFPDDFLLFVDESHMTIPQIGGMYNGDQARKNTLVDYGFRLKGAKDNRPLTFAEFEERRGQAVYVSATPGKYELEKVKVETQETRLEKDKKVDLVAQLLIRPTGIPDPEIEIRPIDGQIDDLLKEIAIRIERHERTLVTTLTKRMAEDITEYLQDRNIKVQYLHSDVKTLDRSQILQDLRLGTYDVLVGINLLREGLDLPEVSLIAILDADKEGFLRSETSLIQTIGRAARHPQGRVIMYANNITGSMRRAIDETDRRRTIQKAYNVEHGIVPQLLNKPITIALPSHETLTVAEEKAMYNRLKPMEKKFYLEELRDKMAQAALHLDYEGAAKLRDQIRELES